jgi:hypothetical protein
MDKHLGSATACLLGNSGAEYEKRLSLYTLTAGNIQSGTGLLAGSIIFFAGSETLYLDLDRIFQART